MRTNFAIDNELAYLQVFTIMETYTGKLAPVDPRTLAGQKAADTRWGRKIERATHQGKVRLGEIVLDCFVVGDGRRIVSQRSLLAALGRNPNAGRRQGSEPLPTFVSANNLRPFISADLAEGLEPIVFRVGSENQVRSGYNAEILPRVCHVYLDAERAGALRQNQQPAADAANVMVRGLSLVGITALVDEATGYQETRAANELQQLLDAYIAEEFRPWIRRFPESFFREVYRLHGWNFVPGQTTHTPYVGQFINKYIYELMPEGVLARLREINPVDENGNRARKHHQHLTDKWGVSHLERQITTVLALMEASDDEEQFEDLFKKATSRAGAVSA